MRKLLITLLSVGVLGGGLWYYFNPESVCFLQCSKNKRGPQDAETHFLTEPTHVSFIQTPLPEVKKTKGVYEPIILKLKNGLQVVVITNKRAPIVKQLVYYKVGGMDDPLGKSGIAHFLEHLMFLGGTRYAHPKQFDKIIDRLGAHKNAYTTYDHTVYFEEVPKEGLEEVIKLEAGRMEELKLTNNLLLPERDVILEERSMRTDNDPGAILDEAVRRTLYQNHTFGRPLIGWRHEMESLNLQDAKDFHYHWYCPNNAIVVFVGDVTLEELKPLIDKYYGSIATRPIKKRDNIQEPISREVSIRLEKVSDRVQQPAFERIYKTSSLSYGNAKEVFPMRVCAYILTTGQTSKLYQHFIKNKKLATSASFSYFDSSMGPGLASFSILPAPGKTLSEVEKELTLFISDLLEKGLTKKEVEQAKSRMLNTFAYARDNVFAGAEAIGSALVRGRSIDEVEFMPDYLRAVTPEKVNHYMREMLKRDDFILSLLVPSSHSQKTIKEGT